MKIWCLKCGKILTEAKGESYGRTTCPCCHSKFEYTVDNGNGCIQALNSIGLLNNRLYIYSTADAGTEMAG